MEIPQIRPGKVTNTQEMPRVVAYFYNAAEANSAIQLFSALGVPSDRLGVTTPDQIEGGQGMVLSVGCPDEKLMPQVESICRKLGAEIHRTNH